ncbi:hypothetical protein F7725_000454 [Dissostichus mawsoni]|uniref:Uncharacterized protein n=1 Tax=Dissostichus mawsoni TaxID=36200 RepID=A0A7J5ZGT9_DISMA|nr:hypothetical protein F7725_000454 [Dissostichus mawsoni]
MHEKEQKETDTALYKIPDAGKDKDQAQTFDTLFQESKKEKVRTVLMTGVAGIENLKRRQKLASALRRRLLEETSPCEHVNPPNQKNTEHIIREVNGESVKRVKAVSDIFKEEDGKTIRTVLTTGVSEIGKSLRVQKFIREWAKNDNGYFTWITDLWARLQAKEVDAVRLSGDGKRLLIPGVSSQFQNILPETPGPHLDHCGAHRIKPGLKKYGADLKLDENTASKRLMLSEENRKEKVERPEHKDRFMRSQVVCGEGMKGLCYWEVEWEGRVGIAVTYEAVGRGWDRSGGLGCNEMSWSLLCSRTQYHSIHGKTWKLIEPKNEKTSKDITSKDGKTSKDRKTSKDGNTSKYGKTSKDFKFKDGKTTKDGNISKTGIHSKILSPKMERHPQMGRCPKTLSQKMRKHPNILSSKMGRCPKTLRQKMRRQPKILSQKMRRQPKILSPKMEDIKR